MRHAWKTAVAVSVLCIAAQDVAGFTLPKHVFRMSQFEKVKELAKSKKAAITFVYTDEGTT
ncbi:MAG: hypothetical protein AB1696_14090 [Planctomycetota bacterium]